MKVQLVDKTGRNLTGELRKGFPDWVDEDTFYDFCDFHLHVTKKQMKECHFDSRDVGLYPGDVLVVLE